MPDGEVITRRRLPHWYVPGAAHFVTYRLAGTIPQALLLEWREECRARIQRCPPHVGRRQYRAETHKRYCAKFDRYLDDNRSIDWLARPAVAALIRQSLHFHDGAKYHLLAYCV